MKTPTTGEYPVSNVNLVCPRCGHYIPNDETPGKYIGAMSRTDNKTEVCSACGTEEGLVQFSDPEHKVTPQSAWPVEPVLPR